MAVQLSAKRAYKLDKTLLIEQSAKEGKQGGAQSKGKEKKRGFGLSNKHARCYPVENDAHKKQEEGDRNSTTWD